MKVGTDGVLLGCMACHPDPDSIRRCLDIGAGTGLVSIMLAQRFAGAEVTGVEIDREAAGQAAENCAASPFAERLSIVRADVNDFAPACGQMYDLIVSNPPYFVQALQCPDDRRNMARHAVGLSFADLTRACARLLAPGGRVAIIIPHDAADALTQAARDAGLAPTSLTTIFSNRRKPPRRAVCHFMRAEEVPAEGIAIEKNELTLLNLDGTNTTEYQNLARDFYLDRK